MPVLPITVYATTDRAAPYKVGEPISADNPLQVTDVPGAVFKVGAPISPTNPLPVSVVSSETYSAGEAISSTNRLPVVIGQGSTDVGEGVGKDARKGLLAVSDLSLVGQVSVNVVDESGSLVSTELVATNQQGDALSVPNTVTNETGSPVTI